MCAHCSETELCWSIDVVLFRRKMVSSSLTKLACIWSRAFQVIHTFIKSSMGSNLYSLRFNIIKINVFEGVSVTQEDSFVDMIIQFMLAFSRQTYLDTTTKCSPAPHISLNPSDLFKRSFVITIMQRYISATDVMVKGIVPKF